MIGLECRSVNPEPQRVIKIIHEKQSMENKERNGFIEYKFISKSFTL
jgi:hypothetical protein